MERLLDLPVPRGVDGVVLSDAMQHPSTQDIGAQHGVAAPRSADVNALLAHSLQQHGAYLIMARRG
jgi:hypothetical protein